MFGPSGEDRPDVLTDAETVVLPIWLHHRPAAEKATPDATAAFLRSITVPAQAREAGVTEPEVTEPEVTEPEVRSHRRYDGDRETRSRGSGSRGSGSERNGDRDRA